MEFKESIGSFLKEYEYKASMSYKAIDNLKNALKGTYSSKSNQTKCEWFLSKDDPNRILVKINENKLALIMSLPIVSLTVGPLFHRNNNNNEDHNDNQVHYVKLTLSIKELIETLDEKFSSRETDRDQITFIFKLDEGQVIIEQIQHNTYYSISDMSVIQIYHNEGDINQDYYEVTWAFQVQDNALFTSLIKSIASAHDPEGNFFIIRYLSKDRLSLLFFFGEHDAKNPQYYCTSIFTVASIKPHDDLEEGAEVRYKTKEISDFLSIFDYRKTQPATLYSIDSDYGLTIEITRDKSQFKVNKRFNSVSM